MTTRPEPPGVIAVEVDAHDFEALARARCIARGASAPEATGPGTRVLAFLAPAGALDDCKVLAVDGRVVGFLHGTDCELSAGIARDLGRSGPLDWACQRHVAGGAFEVVELPACEDERGAA